MKVRIWSVLAALFLPLLASAGWDDDKGCLTCHEGIERIADTPTMKELACTFCHKGNGEEARDVKVAHKGMFANPADFRVIDQTCGTCHADHMANGKKSLHATMAGMISGTRYGFGAQDRKSKYGTYAVKRRPHRPARGDLQTIADSQVRPEETGERQQ